LARHLEGSGIKPSLNAGASATPPLPGIQDLIEMLDFNQG